MTGKGKTTLMEHLLCQEVDGGNKGFDSGDVTRLEPAHYALAEDRSRFLRALKVFGISPKRYDVRVWYLHFDDRRIGRRYETLPGFFEPYVLPWNLMTADDLVRLVKHRGESGTRLAEMVCDRALMELAEESPDADFKEIPNRMAEMTKDKSTKFFGYKEVEAKTVIPLARRLLEFARYGAIGPISHPEALDLAGMMRQLDVIDATTFFNVRLDHARHGIMAFLFRWVPQVRFEEGPFPPMAWLLREATKWAPVTLEYEEQRDTREAFQRIIKDIRDYGVRFLIENQQMRKLYGPVASQVDVELILGQSIKDLEPMFGLIPRRILRKLRGSNPGQGMIFSGANWDLPVFYAPTRHRHKEANEDILLLLSLKEYQDKYNYGWKRYLPGSGITREEREELARERVLHPLILFCGKRGFTPFRAKEFAEVTGINTGTVRRMLREYEEEYHVLVRAKRGLYCFSDNSKNELESLVQKRTGR